MPPSQSKVWLLTQEAFDELLAHLDPDREQAGEKYEIIRRKLVRFFEWRGCAFPEDYADAVINRVTRRISEGEEIRDFQSYSYGVARLVFLETLKEQDKVLAAIEDVPGPQTVPEEPEGSAVRIECLQSCLGDLSVENRDLIIEYYREEKGAKIKSRKALAERLGIPPNALRIRTHRIRTTIEECVGDCLKAQE